MKQMIRLKSVAWWFVALTVAPCWGFNLSLQLEGDQARLSWPSQGAGKVYTVQYRPALGTGRWTPLLPWDDWPMAGTTFAERLGAEGARLGCGGGLMGVFFTGWGCSWGGGGGG